MSNLNYDSMIADKNDCFGKWFDNKIYLCKICDDRLECKKRTISVKNKRKEEIKNMRITKNG